MSYSQTSGYWDPAISFIVTWRPQLNSFEEFSSVLIHDLVHAQTGCSDVTRDFENALTTTIGDLCLGWWNFASKNALIQKSIDMSAPKELVKQAFAER